MDKIIKNILSDARVMIMDQYDLNFQRKGFFDQPWPQTRIPNRKGSLMMRTGALRRGMRAHVNGFQIIFSNSQPYARLHNNGGVITVTAKMKKFFWAMYLNAAAGAGSSGGKRKVGLSAEAEMWKALALKKVGSQMRVPQRQFVGFHPAIVPLIKKAVDQNLGDIDKYMKSKLKRK